MQTKTCQTCGKAFVRPESVSAAQWAGRRFCSKPCIRKPAPQGKGK